MSRKGKKREGVIMHVLMFLTEYGRSRNQTRETSPVVMTERWEGKVWGGGRKLVFPFL